MAGGRVVRVQFAVGRAHHLHRAVAVGGRKITQRALLRSFRPCVRFTGVRLQSKTNQEINLNSYKIKTSYFYLIARKSVTIRGY